jgi:2-keto-4-pentenoate hydratase/2-oxohepta-3-ene-1,7-dioic acid hydratase in catechol pathway
MGALYQLDCNIYRRSSATRLARTLHLSQESFVVIDSSGKAITSDEIAKETGLAIPEQLEKFLFSGHLQKTIDLLDNLSFAHSINEFKILPPIKEAYKIICLAFNYTDQGNWVRFGRKPPTEPVIYLKPRTCLIGPTDDILCPRFVKQLDYEGELALTIGRKCKNISTKEASEYIAGYFVLNDVSAREIQFIDKQYTRAKGFDTFGPCGPWLTTADEIRDPCNLHITTRVNGDIRQDSSTANLVLKVNEIISKLSKVMTLEPGDIISTGTPSGTALSLSSDLKYLKHNDIVEVEIEELGKITNRVQFID